MPAVQREAGVRVDVEVPQSERLCHYVGDDAGDRVVDLDRDVVEVRVPGAVPQVRLVDRDSLPILVSGMPVDGVGRSGPVGDDPAVLVGEHGAHHDRPVRRRAVGHLGGHLDHRGGPADVGLRQVHPGTRVVEHVDAERVDRPQCDVPVEAALHGVVGGQRCDVGVVRVVDAHRDDVVGAGAHRRRGVEAELRVSAGVPPEVRTVGPHVGDLVRGAEVQHEAFAAVR